MQNEREKERGLVSKMKTFSLTKKMDADVMIYTISGYVDEHAQFPLTTDFAKTVHIDLSQAEGMNSIGTKNWCQWMDTLKPPLELFVAGCPPIFIKAFNTVMGALPKNMKILSFQVPYIGDNGNEPRQDILFRINHEFHDNGTLRAPKVTDEAGRELEMDVLPTYFNFLKR